MRLCSAPHEQSGAGKPIVASISGNQQQRLARSLARLTD